MPDSKEVEKLKRDLATLEDIALKRAQTIRRLQKELVDNRDIDNEKIKEQAELIVELQEEVNKLEQENAALEAERDQADDMYVKATERLVVSDGANKRQKSLIDQFTAEHERLHQIIGTHEQDKAKLIIELKAAQKTIERAAYADQEGNRDNDRRLVWWDDEGETGKREWVRCFPDEMTIYGKEGGDK